MPTSSTAKWAILARTQHSPTDELIAKQFSSARNPCMLWRTAHVPQSDRRLRTGTSLVLQLTPILFSLRCSSGVHQSNPALWSTRTLNYVLVFYSEFCSPLLGGNPHYATIYRSASPIHCISAPLLSYSTRNLYNTA